MSHVWQQMAIRYLEGRDVFERVEEDSLVAPPPENNQKQPRAKPVEPTAPEPWECCGSGFKLH